MNILLLDIEPVVLDTLRDFLGDLGHRVTTARSLSELQQRLLQTSLSPGLVILSVNLPCGESLAAIDWIHRQYPDTPLVLTSGYTPMWGQISPIPLAKALEYGVYAYLRKPIHFRELELLVYRLAESGLQRTQKQSPAQAASP